MLAGRCAQPGVNPEAWFPERGAWTRANTAAVIACRSCPVRAACLAYAIEHGQRHGIWGGLTVIQRRRVLRLPALPAGQTHPSR
jgi:WhiB family redox-sensing transcriptional regulator